MATTIAGFTAIPVSYSAAATHFIYARQHSNSHKSKSPTFPDVRTLFLVNVPPDATEREIIQFFKYCGTVERVEFDQEDSHETDDAEESSEGEESEDEVEEDYPRKRRNVKGDKKQPPKVVPLPTVPLRKIRRTGRNCHLVFLDSSSIDKAVSKLQLQKPRPWPTDPEVPSGLAHYIALYDSLRPPLDVVREHACTSVAVYQHQRDSKRQQSKYHKGEAIVDEDGFTLVTRGGAYGKTLGGEVGVASKKFMSNGGLGKRTRKKDKKEKDRFYTFQTHEKNRKSTSYCFILWGFGLRWHQVLSNLLQNSGRIRRRSLSIARNEGSNHTRSIVCVLHRKSCPPRD